MDLKTDEVEKKVRVVAVHEGGVRADLQVISSGLPEITDYTVLELIGVGSLTEVYKVKRQGIDTIFAAKVLRHEMAGNPRTAKRFKQEGEKAVGLNDPHLVSVYETAYTSEGRPVLICDFFEGETLADRLAREKKMFEQDVLVMLKQLLPALSLAHKNKSIHRDLKPANIVFHTGQGAEIVKFTDFGIAKVIPSVGRETKYITPDGEAFGNPTYMAPEQLQGAKLDGRSDIYSLGCLIYECLTGAPPFKSSNPVRLALKQLQNEPPPFFLSSERHVSRSLESVIMRMLRKNPGDRYQSVEELLRDLEVVEKGGQPKIPPLKPAVELPTVKPKPVAAASTTDKKYSSFPALNSAVSGRFKIKGKQAEASLSRENQAESASLSTRGRASERRREEAFFVVSVLFFFLSVAMFIPACVFTIGMKQAFDSRDYRPAAAASEGPVEFRYLRDGRGRKLVAYVEDDLGNVMSSTSHSNRLRGVVLTHLRLPRARMSHLDLSESKISHCDFTGADLHGTSFRNAEIHKVNFDNTNLTDCDFVGARFYGCSFMGAITSTESDDNLLQDSGQYLILGAANGRLQKTSLYAIGTERK